MSFDKDAFFKNCVWWSILLTAVMGVASFSLIVTSTLIENQLADSTLFILTCWLCVHYGLRMLREADVRDRLGLTPVSENDTK